MLSPDEKQVVGETTRILQIIVLALVGGPLSFLIFTVLQPPPQQLQKSLVLPGLAFAAVAIVGAVVMPQIIGAQIRKAVVERRPLGKNQAPPASDAAGLLAGLQTRRIIAGAILEGAAFFNIFVYMQGRQPYSLAASIVLIAGILLLVPLRPLVEHWLERELRTIRELRGLR